MLTRKRHGYTGRVKSVSLGRQSGEQARKLIRELNARAKADGISGQAELIKILSTALVLEQAPPGSHQQESKPVT